MSTSRARYNIFYHKTDDGTRLEIGFLIQRNGKLLPIEVKAEGNVSANSLSNLLKQNPELHAESLDSCLIHTFTKMFVQYRI